MVWAAGSFASLGSSRLVRAAALGAASANFSALATEDRRGIRPRQLSAHPSQMPVRIPPSIRTGPISYCHSCALDRGDSLVPRGPVGDRTQPSDP
jgi:hypothetical protein